MSISPILGSDVLTFGFKLLRGSLLSFTPLISPHPLAVPRYHQGPTSREAGGGGGPKTRKAVLFYCNEPGKTDLGSFQRRKYSGTIYLLPLQLHFFAKLLNFHLQLFLFWQIFDVKSRHFRPRTGPGDSSGSGEAGSAAHQGASRNNSSARAPRPPASADDTASRVLPRAPRAQLPPGRPVTPALRPRIFLGPPRPREACPSEPGRVEWRGSLRSWALPELRVGCWPPAGSRACHALGGPARAAGPTAGVALAHFPGETTKVLLFVPFFFFPFPSHIRVLFVSKKRRTLPGRK